MSLEVAVDGELFGADVAVETLHPGVKHHVPSQIVFVIEAFSTDLTLVSSLILVSLFMEVQLVDGEKLLAAVDARKLLLARVMTDLVVLKTQQESEGFAAVPALVGFFSGVFEQMFLQEFVSHEALATRRTYKLLLSVLPLHVSLQVLDRLATHRALGDGKVVFDLTHDKKYSLSLFFLAEYKVVDRDRHLQCVVKVGFSLGFDFH